jgi:hypothetical protein
MTRPRPTAAQRPSAYSFPGAGKLLTLPECAAQECCMEPVDPKDPKATKERRPWQPRMGDGQDFNPMVRVTAPGGDVAPEPTLEQVEEQTEESEAREDDPEPIKIP